MSGFFQRDIGHAEDFSRQGVLRLIYKNLFVCQSNNSHIPQPGLMADPKPLLKKPHKFKGITRIKKLALTGFQRIVWILLFPGGPRILDPLKKHSPRP
jgi:hypothetical protein